MPSGPRINDASGPFRRIFGDGTVSGMDEGELLRRFATRRDPSALEALVVRHGPMVLGVCRRVLMNREAADDAFQATFLVLARKAGSIRDPDRLGPWLHGVAHRVALRSRADRARRQDRERTGTEEPAMATTPGEPDFDRAELKATLDEEVRRLPQKFRDPIVLCYLDGLTHDEAAAHLACPVGTIRSRLATGREKLRDRLTRRGVTVPSALFAGVLTAETASAAVSPALLLFTVRASTAFASGMAGAMAAGLVPASVASLAEGVTTTMIVSKLKIIGALALTGVMTLGVGAATAQRLAGSGEAEKTTQKADETPEQQITKLKAQAVEAEARAKILESEVKSLKRELEAANQGTAPAGPDAVAILQARRDGKAAELQKAEAQKRAAAISVQSVQKLVASQGISQAESQKYEAELEIAEAQVLGKKAELDEADILLNRAKRRPEAALTKTTSTQTKQAVRAPEMMPGMGGAASGIGGPGAPGLPEMPGAPGMTGSGTLTASSPGQTGGRSATLGLGSKTMIATEPGIPTYRTDEFVIVHKPKSDKVASYSNETGEWTSYQVPQGMDVVPIFSRSLVALYCKGDSIPQIATFIPQLGQWYPIDLKEPAKGQATPIVNNNLAVYAIDRRVYGFSTAAHGWDVLELPEGAKPGVVTTSNTATVEHGDTVYLFNASRGKWTSFNSKTGEAGQSEKK